MKRWFAAQVAAIVVAFMFAGQTPAQTKPADVVKDAITGTMQIDFNTRTQLDQSGDLKPNSAALGVKDKYSPNLTVNKFINFTGTIERQPNLFSSMIGRKKQDAELYYNLTVNIVNPSNIQQHRAVGKMVGVVPIDTQSGAFNLAGGAAKESPLRLDVDSVGSIKAYKDNFDGKLIGKAEKKESLASYTMKRLLPNGQTASVTIKRSDPMRFENMRLAKGPSDNYPPTTVNGTLNYDYETGNYFADGIRFTYPNDGKDVTDTVTGSIKWVEDANRKANGKGHYEFNIRFNEDANKPKGDETSAFGKMSEEEAFFAVDNTIPSLTGNVDYTDTMSGDTVTASKVEYHLDANRLSKQQVMAFFKMWLISVGPTNDE